MQHQIAYGSQTIGFILQYRKRKSLGIKVHPDGTVEVLAPLNATEDEILEKIKKKGAWILKQLNHFNSYKPATSPRKFIGGETHLYLGKQYRLKVISDEKNCIKLYRGQLWMYTTNIQPEILKQQLDVWYKKKAIDVFAELMDEVLPQFNRFKIGKPLLSIRYMSKRWGSCTPSGKIILNTELIKAPKGSIKYVIVHELAHLVHYNHTRAFLNLQNRILPDWKKWKDRLEYCLSTF